MKKIILLLCLFSGLNLSAQLICEPSLISNFLVQNNSNDTLFFVATEKLEINLPKADNAFVVQPKSTVKIKQLEWADSFKNPTTWFLFYTKNKQDLNKPLNTESNWIFNKIDSLNANFTFINN